MNLFNYLKNQISILDVVNEYTSLKKAGAYWKGHCPFHNEKTASFTVSPHKAIFYCFGCNTGGDVISFIASVENCTPIEAAKQLIERYQINLPETIAYESSSASVEEKKLYLEICKLVAQWCHENLLRNASVLGYLTKRNIDAQQITYFSIGYFPGGLAANKNFLSYMQRHNILAHDLVQAGILHEGKTVMYSPFEERIIFPIKDHLGRNCGFGGRIFTPQDERAKYYNSRENDFFSKGSLLFGLDKAKKSIQEKEFAFLVEGYTDCVAMVQHGYPNTVATLGTACTLEHLTVLSRYAQQLYVLYDGDNAGQDAMLRLTQLCWQVDMELKVICLPAQDDPATYLNNNKNLDSLIEQAADIFEFFIRTLGKDFTDEKLGKKLQLARRIVDVISQVVDPLKQDILLKKAAKTLDIPFESIKKEMTNKPSKRVPPEAKDAPNEQPTLAPSTLEKKVFFAIMQNIQLFNDDNEEYIIAYIPNPLQGILKKLKEARHGNPGLDFIQFFDMLSPEQQQDISRILLHGEQETSNQEFEQLMVQLHKIHWKRTVLMVKNKLAYAQDLADKDTIEKILRDFLELKRKILEKNII